MAQELKAETIVPQGSTITLQMYPKAEVDAVLAEKDKQIAELKDKLKHKSEEYANTCRFYENELSRQKYKRCLAMAKWCECKRIDAADYRIPRKKWEFYDKWQKRWLALAEKFKEAK